jgi:Flp pilus assembly protein CpaB
VLVALAVVLAFVLNILALQDRSATTLVAVAAQPIAAGARFTPDLVRLVPVAADFEGVGSLVDEGRLDSFSGHIVQRPVEEGGVIEISLLAEPAAASGLRSMSIPIDPARAAGGSITVGDRVDVVTVRDDAAIFVATDLEVLGVSPVATSALNASDPYLVVAVGPRQALHLAEALAAGPVDVLRSTGAAPVDAGGGDGAP